MLEPQSLTLADIATWMRQGVAIQRRLAVPSALYAGALAWLAVLMFLAAWLAGAVPMVYALVSGFLLVGSIASSGLMLLALMLERGEPLSLKAMLRRWSAIPGLFALLGFSLFLWLIWVTDAGILYGLYFRQAELPFMPMFGFSEPLAAFLLFSGLMGAVPAIIMLAVATFAVPLVLEARCSLPRAVGLSVRALRINLLVLFFWAACVALLVALSLCLLPLFLWLFPVLCFASFVCYRQVFPLA